jgi:curli biogenesis system outer membrane secretion channel CsgG
MRRRLAFLLCLSLGAAAWAQGSAFSSRIDQFTRSLAAQLSAKAAKGSSIAVADFDNKEAGAGDPDLGYAVSEILTQDLQRSGDFVVLERKQLEQILKTMELQLSGLYDSDKAAAIGKLIDAKYLVLGSITKAAGFYRVSVRVVEVETGSIFLSDSVELDAALLESEAGKYLPPRYRAFIGSSMSWFATTPGGLGTYSIGLALGGSYQIARNQWLSLETIFYFWHYLYADSLQIGDTSTAGSFMSGDYRLLDTFVLLGEYGYRLPLSRVVSLQPTLGLGAVIGGLNATEEYASWSSPVVTGYTPTVTTSTSVWASPAAQLRLDLVFLEKEPLSFYIGTGYFIYARELSRTNHALDTNVLINGIKLEGALMVYF